MVGPLLETKLDVPARRRGLVSRPRLRRRLEDGAHAALLLVCAPAGFGKTTLVTEWLTDEAHAGRQVAWLSLDERDNDPVAFWTYLVAALNAAKPHTIGPETRAILDAPQPALDAVVAAVVNELHHVASELVLVLDDYHVVEAPQVRETVALFMEHLPRRTHVVITSRIDPDLPLALMRARGELVEIRAEDLRFTDEEAATYLADSMGLRLSEADVAALGERTEGWIAALQLAALSMQGREDPTAFIAGFAGDDRYIVDFLTQEVLRRQPSEVQNFLLRTSILDRLSAPLCDALTGRDDGAASLAALEQANLFLIPLDAQRRWYRYHSLFADVLHARLCSEQPDQVEELHRRASVWFENAGDVVEAVDHAMTARDHQRAATLMERAMPQMRRNRQEGLMRGWFPSLPQELLSARPVLSVAFAGAMAASGEFEGMEDLLRDAERWLDPPAAVSAGDEAVVVDQEEFARLPATVAMLRAGRALAAGDLEATAEHAQDAIGLSPSDDSLPRAGATALLGLASWARGDLEPAERAYAEAITMLRRLGHHSDALGCALALADITVAQGRLGDALRIHQQGLDLMAARGSGPLRGSCDMHVGLSALHCERGELDAARTHLERSQDLGEHLGLPQNRYRSRVAKAHLLQAEGDLDTALGLLVEAERVYTGDFSPNVRPVPAIRARLHLARGEVAEAQAWAREQRLSADDELSYVREYEHVTFAKVQLAQFAQTGMPDTLASAESLLKRLLDAAEDGGRQGVVLEVLMLQAVAHELRGDAPQALHCLERALRLAEPEGHVRVFVLDAPRLTAPLKALAKGGGPAAPYARRLLAAAESPARTVPVAPSLVDPLSERELEVLRLLSTELDGPGMARHLVVSLNTVRTHTKHIYTKLGVNSRRAAVRQARDLGLL